MTTALPFTEASLRKAIRAVRKEGLHIVGIKTDGTLLVSSAAVDVDVSPVVQQAIADAEARRRWGSR